MEISRVILHDEPAEPALRTGRLARFVEAELGVPAEARGSVFEGMPESAARELASVRVFSPGAPPRRREPGPDEVALEAAGGGAGTAYYDGFGLAGVVGGLIPEADLAPGALHVAFTRRLACTYDAGDGRYHGRALIASNPAVISTDGMVEAPARPREYYAELLMRMAQGLNLAVLARRHAAWCLSRGDARLSTVAEGYLLQAAAHYAAGEAFCADRGCRLFNAHWQADLLRSQGYGRLCARHARALAGIRQ